MIRPRRAKTAPVSRSRNSYTAISTAASAAFHFTGRTCCGAMPSSSTSSWPRMWWAALGMLVPRVPKMRSIVVTRAENRFPAPWSCSPMPKCTRASRPSSEWSKDCRKIQLMPTFSDAFYAALASMRSRPSSGIYTRAIRMS